MFYLIIFLYIVEPETFGPYCTRTCIKFEMLAYEFLKALAIFINDDLMYVLFKSYDITHSYERG